MLNITRPAVLHQYYGLNNTIINISNVERSTYQYNDSANQVVINPLKYITKPLGDI